MLRILLILLIAVALGACALTRSPVSSTVAAPEVIDAHLHVLAALRWPKLTTPSEDHASEIRVWLDHGLVVPHHMLRVRQQDFRVAAEVVRWWPNDPQLLKMVEPNSGLTFAESQAKGCTTLRKSKTVTVCLMPLPEALATTASSDLAALNVWHLQERRMPKEGLFVVTADGESITVELRNAHIFRRMTFVTSNDQAFQYDPQAKLVADFVSRLVGAFDLP